MPGCPVVVYHGGVPIMAAPIARPLAILPSLTQAVPRKAGQGSTPTIPDNLKESIMTRHPANTTPGQWNELAAPSYTSLGDNLFISLEVYRSGVVVDERHK